MREWDVDVLDCFVFFFPVVPADPPFVAEQCDRKLILKLVDDGELCSIQILIRVHQRIPNEADNQPSGWYQYIPPAMPKRRKENNEQCHQTGIQRQQVVVGVLALVADMLRRLDKKFVLLQQVFSGQFG